MRGNRGNRESGAWGRGGRRAERRRRRRPCAMKERITWSLRLYKEARGGALVQVGALKVEPARVRERRRRVLATRGRIDRGARRPGLGKTSTIRSAQGSIARFLRWRRTRRQGEHGGVVIWCRDGLDDGLPELRRGDFGGAWRKTQIGSSLFIFQNLWGVCILLSYVMM